MNIYRFRILILINCAILKFISSAVELNDTDTVQIKKPHEFMFFYQNKVPENVQRHNILKYFGCLHTNRHKCSEEEFDLYLYNFVIDIIGKLQLYIQPFEKFRSCFLKIKQDLMKPKHGFSLKHPSFKLWHFNSLNLIDIVVENLTSSNFLVMVKRETDPNKKDTTIDISDDPMFNGRYYYWRNYTILSNEEFMVRDGCNQHIIEVFFSEKKDAMIIIKEI